MQYDTLDKEVQDLKTYLSTAVVELEDTPTEQAPLLAVPAPEVGAFATKQSQLNLENRVAEIREELRQLKKALEDECEQRLALYLELKQRLPEPDAIKGLWDDFEKTNKKNDTLFLQTDARLIALEEAVKKAPMSKPVEIPRAVAAPQAVPASTSKPAETPPAAPRTLFWAPAASAKTTVAAPPDSQAQNQQLTREAVKTEVVLQPASQPAPREEVPDMTFAPEVAAPPPRFLVHDVLLDEEDSDQSDAAARPLARLGTAIEQAPDAQYAPKADIVLIDEIDSEEDDDGTDAPGGSSQKGCVIG